MKTLYKQLKRAGNSLKDLSLLMFRLILSFGFYEPALMKARDPGSIAGWFESMDYPMPLMSAWLVMITELLGVVLLALGLGTRIIAVPLMVAMLVAIFTVHLSNGFAAGENGFEIPLYYFLMLFALLTHGSGKYSLDHLVGTLRR